MTMDEERNLLVGIKYVGKLHSKGIYNLCPKSDCRTTHLLIV